MTKTLHTHNPSNLADILDRVLDKGIVIAGDVAISLVGVELLTIRLRLLISSVDKAREMGISWWESDPFLAGDQRALEQENKLLRERLDLLEARLGLENSAPDLAVEEEDAPPALARPTRSTSRRTRTRSVNKGSAELGGKIKGASGPITHEVPELERIKRDDDAQ